MKVKLFVFTLFAYSLVCFSQEIISQNLYKGKIGKHEISLYLKISEDGCPNVFADGMYKYKSNKTNEWILLKINYDHKDDSDVQNFIMVEIYNTGVLLLEQKENKLNGKWISPDGKKQLNVELKESEISNSEKEKLEDKLNEEYYVAHDC